MDDDSARSSAKAIAVRLAAAFGIEADAAAVLDGGNENHVVHLTTGRRDVVVRFARDDSRAIGDPFDVEAWCAGAIDTEVMSTPGLVGRGHVDGVSVLILEFIAGAPATADDLAAWRAAGRMAAALPSVAIGDAPDSLFSRFGRDLDRAWAEHLEYNIEALERADPLIPLGVYEPDQGARLRSMLDRLRDRNLAQGLVHGDLSTRNLIASDGRYVVVDWGSARTGPTPWTDLERIHHWWNTGDSESRVSTAAWNAVLDGAGVSRASVEPILGELGALNALDVVRWATDRKPDRVQELVPLSASTIRRSLATTEA